MKRQLVMVALAAAIAAPSALAVTDAQLKAIKKNINGVPVPELPAKAAELVTQASKEDRETVAVTVVRAAIHKSRPSAPLVVAAVSKAAPEVASPVSRVAAELESGQADSISAAAVGAAPQSKSQIVNSVHQGLFGSSDVSSSVSSSLTSGSTASSTVNVVPTATSPVAFTARGGAKTEHGGQVHSKPTPINENHSNRGHGDGHGDDDDDHHGRFPEHPPFGDRPPGHDPDHHGKPPFVDYTKPRCY
jgi:hypothetical protein